jgi:hypothetical protein
MMLKKAGLRGGCGEPATSALVANKYPKTRQHRQRQRLPRISAMSDIPSPDTPQPDIPVPPQPDLPAPEPTEIPGDDVPKVG